MTLPKIDEWIKEAETRPASAQTILKLIAGRLRELTGRNEELLAENIALQDGTRVEQYRKQIALLEYQFDLLRRRFGLGAEELAALAVEPAPAPLCLLAYRADGRILRLEPAAGKVRGELLAEGEAPRLLAAPSSEELLLLFTSGRVATCAVEDIPLATEWNLDQAALPHEPHAGERLACLTPISGLALADALLQASRRGCVKKTMLGTAGTSMAGAILENHYLGRGAVQRLDQPFDLTLCGKGGLFVLVTHEGRLLGLDVDGLSYAVEERIKLEPHDHVVAGFLVRPGELLLCLTQTGKVISRVAGVIEPARTANTHGQALIPPGRLEQGVRFIGAAAVRETSRLALLDAAGNLSLHDQSDLSGAGALHSEAPLVAFCVLPEDVENKNSP
jgi:hypothetical protein